MMTAAVSTAVTIKNPVAFQMATAVHMAVAAVYTIDGRGRRGGGCRRDGGRR